MTLAWTPTENPSVKKNAASTYAARCDVAIQSWSLPDIEVKKPVARLIVLVGAATV